MKFCQVRKSLFNELISLKYYSNFFLFYKIQTVDIAYHNTEALSCNHRCSGKTLSITYSECVFVASVMQHAVRDILRRI